MWVSSKEAMLQFNDAEHGLLTGTDIPLPSKCRKGMYWKMALIIAMEAQQERESDWNFSFASSTVFMKCFQKTTIATFGSHGKLSGGKWIYVRMSNLDSFVRPFNSSTIRVKQEARLTVFPTESSCSLRRILYQFMLSVLFS